MWRFAEFALHCFKSGFGGKGKCITCSGFCGLGCERTKVSHVTGSLVLGEKGKGVTCYGLLHTKMSHVTL